MAHGDGLETFLGGAVTDFLPLQLKDAPGSRLMVHGENNGITERQKKILELVEKKSFHNSS